jgi:hypothetical protein
MSNTPRTEKTTAGHLISARSPEMHAFCTVVDSRIWGAEPVIAEFGRSIAKDPVEALRWVNEAVLMATRLGAWREVKKILGNNASRSDAEIFSLITAAAERAIYDVASAGASRSSGFLDGHIASDTLKAWMNVRETVSACRVMNAPK